jgi:outer membrane protein OmpU
MNIVKKIGLTALGTSLVASSAFAAELTVSGGAGYTYSSEDNTGSARGSEAIGYNHHISIGGSTELDNGWTVSSNMVIEPSLALSSSHVKVVMGSMGTVAVGTGYGGIGANFDDATPRAYEENHDGMVTSTAIDNIGANLDNGQVNYVSPSFDMGSGYSVTLHGEFAPTGNDAAVYDGGTAAASNFGTGMGAAFVVTGNGLTAGAYVNEIESSRITLQKTASTSTAFANYAIGSVTLGLQMANTDRGVIGAAEAATTAKTVAAATGEFETQKMSIAFAVNDDLSISYGRLTETYDAQDNNATAIADVEMESDSYQVAYSMGAMSISAYHTSTDNPGWDSDATSQDINEIALNFAF